MKLIYCPECGKQISARAARCIHCGYIPQKVTCPECGALYNAESEECPNCGYNPLEVKLAAERMAAERERLRKEAEAKAAEEARKRKEAREAWWKKNGKKVIIITIVIVGIIVVSIISFFAKSSIELKNAHKDVAALFAAGDSCMSVYDSCMSVYAWTEAKQYYYKALKYENIPNLDKQVEAKITKLKGKRGFSVDSSGKHVIFSKGNLQYQASTDTWRFALNQWDYVGDSIYGTVYENGVKCDNSKISSTYSGWIDLFGWGTGDKPTFSSGESWRYDIFSDWGENLTNGDTHSNKWKTLTMDEWEYLYQARTNASKLRSQATVNGVYGYIFLPDNWSLPSGMSFTADADDYATNNYSTTNWSKMESAGAVFLPSMGGTAATQMWTI